VTMRQCMRAAALLLLCLLHSNWAHAYSCSATSPGTQSVASVSPVQGSAYQVSGVIAVTCTVGLLESLANGSSIIACLNITGGSGSSYRTLTSSAGGTLQYNLYSDSAHSQVWGAAATAPPNPVWVNFNLGLLNILLGGSFTYNVPIYTYVPSGQLTAAAGTYQQSLSGANANVTYIAYVGTQPACSAGWASGGSFAFTVQATVINDCKIAATNVNFGTAGVINSALPATGTITAQCTYGDNYSIALNGGSASGATVTSRAMTLAGGGATVGYGLYADAGRSTIWGDGTAGTTTSGSSANGSNQSFTVYGLVPAQRTPVPGNYSDTVTATISY
jgi:spore coat protein U-like protein